MSAVRVERIGRWVCEECGSRFEREKSGSRPIRFCCAKCYQSWRMKSPEMPGCFRTGSSPWNRDVKGIHLSPNSEFKKGCQSNKLLPVGAVTFRKDKSGNDRAWVKVGQPSQWKERAVLVWEQQNGPLPFGHVVHHRDHDSINDTPDNLQALTRADHARHHSLDRWAAKRADQAHMFDEPLPMPPEVQSSMFDEDAA